MSDVIETEKVDESNFTDLIPNNQQPTHKAFIYRVFMPDESKFIVTVIAQTATGAKEGLKNHIPTAELTYLGTSTVILQVNG